MSDAEVPLTRLYLIGATCLLFGTAYGFLDLEPGPFMAFCLRVGPPLGVAGWLAADSRRSRLAAVYDAGWLFYLGWPVVVPWYTLRTRGRAGWWVALQLYTIALAGVLGIAWGGVIRALTQL